MASTTSYTVWACLSAGAALCAATSAQAQEHITPNASSLQSCAAVVSDSERLACFDALVSQPSPIARSGNPAWYGTTPESTAVPPTTTAQLTLPVAATPTDTDNGEGCRNNDYDTTSRMWELTSETDCGNFRFRGYRPMIFALSTSNRINRQPYSPGLENGLAEYQDYQRPETRIQLSIRTKLASNIFTNKASNKRDSLWFGFTSNSYWQAFNGTISRPFRNTDYQPEMMYVYPLEWKLLGQAKLRYAGLGISHQSNGQSNPLSRSWNRYYMMLGLDVNPDVRLQARLWHRIKEDAAKDDNPNISDYIGRGEFTAAWDVNKTNTLVMTARNSLRSNARGSAQLEWYHTLGEQLTGGKSNLRLYTSLFSGYGDSLIDYNFRRTVFSVGVSLLDF